LTTHQYVVVIALDFSKAGYTLATKTTVAKTSNKVDYRRYGRFRCRFWRQIGNNLNSTAFAVANSVDFVANTVEFVAGTVDFVASVYGAKATRLTLSTFNKVDRVEFNFVASVYRA